jgi:lysophospholipase
MKYANVPVSRIDIPPDGELKFAKTVDKKIIRYAVWPKGDKGFVLFLNGRNEYIEKYNNTYKKFQEMGFGVITLDWRSQGFSERPSWNNNLGYVEDFLHYQYDIEAVLEDSSFSSRSGTRILVGHSTGACIGLRTLLERSYNFDSAIFLSPLWGWGDKVKSRFVRKFFLASSYVITKIGLGHISFGPQPKQPYVLTQSTGTNVLTSDFSQFKRLQDIASKEPGLSTGAPSFSWIASAQREIENLQKTSGLDIPVLVAVGSEDNLISQDAAKLLCKKNPSWIFKFFTNARHELLIEKEEVVEKLWYQIETFLSANN